MSIIKWYIEAPAEYQRYIIDLMHEKDPTRFYAYRTHTIGEQYLCINFPDGQYRVDKTIDLFVWSNE